jgi:hypothetical protein
VDRSGILEVHDEYNRVLYRLFARDRALIQATIETPPERDLASSNLAARG